MKERCIKLRNPRGYDLVTKGEIVICDGEVIKASKSPSGMKKNTVFSIGDDIYWVIETKKVLIAEKTR